MIDLVRLVLSSWKTWRLRKATAKRLSLAAERYRLISEIEQARRHHRPVRSLQRQLQDVTHARLRAALKIEA